MEAESESTSTTENELSNGSAVWFPMHEGNSWTLVSPSGVSRTVSYQGVYDGVGYLSGLMFEGRWMGDRKSVV